MWEVVRSSRSDVVSWRYETLSRSSSRFLTTYMNYTGDPTLDDEMALYYVHFSAVLQVRHGSVG